LALCNQIIACLAKQTNNDVDIFKKIAEC
jgi:hypothetical protein